MPPTLLYTVLASAAGVFLLSVVSGICRVVAATGAYMIFAMGWTLAGAVGLGTGSMKEVAGYIIFFDFGSIFVVWSLRRSLDPWLVSVIGIPWILLEVAGTALLIHHNQSPWLKRTFGLLLFAVLLCDAVEQRRVALQQARAAKDRCRGQPAVMVGRGGGGDEQGGDVAPKAPVLPTEDTDAAGKAQAATPVKPGENAAPPPASFDLRKPRNLGWALFLGIVGGLLKGVFTVPMPALSAFVLFSGIDRDLWRCNMIVVQLSTTPMKALYFFVVRSQFEAARALEYVAVSIGAVVALPAGLRISKSINKEEFKNFIRALTFTGAVSMCTTKTPCQLWLSLLALLSSSSLAIFWTRGARLCCWREDRKAGAVEKAGLCDETAPAAATTPERFDS